MSISGAAAEPSSVSLRSFAAANIMLNISSNALSSRLVIVCRRGSSEPLLSPGRGEFSRAIGTRGCPVAISSNTWSHGEFFGEKIEGLHYKKITVIRNSSIIFPGVRTDQKKENRRSELERSNDTQKLCELLRLRNGVGRGDLMF